LPSGLSERVIYRELFPSGLTLLDKGHLGELGTSHLVARQELRALLAGAAPADASGGRAGTGAAHRQRCHDAAFCGCWSWPAAGLPLITGRWPWQFVGRMSNDRRIKGRPAAAGLPNQRRAQEIIDAHRRLIAQVHPDRGGSNEAVHEANAARDLLLAGEIESNRSESMTHSSIPPCCANTTFAASSARRWADDAYAIGRGFATLLAPGRRQQGRGGL
jgi:hypothetical protein